MKKQPIYTTKNCHAVNVAAKRPRRRIGELPNRLRLDIQSLDKHTATACKISAAMMVASIVNPLNF